MKRITHEEFVLRLKKENPSIEVLGKFNGILSPIKVRCSNMHEWEPIANSILRARKKNKNTTGCATCSGKKQKTHEQFVAELMEISPSIQVLSEFLAVDKKVMVCCKKCRYEWSTTGNALLRKSGCRICALESSKAKQRKSSNQFKLDAAVANPNIEILGKYTNVKTHINCRCKVCNHEWDILPSNLLKGRGCPKCSGHLSMTNDEYLEKLKEVQPNIQVLGKYLTNQTKAPCKCTICNWEWEPPLHRLLKGRGCPSCAGVPDITHDIFISKIAEIRKDLTVIGKYTAMRKSIACRCNVCSYTWDAPAQHIWKGSSGCPQCAAERTAEASRKTNDEFINDFRANNLNFQTIKLHNQYKNSLTRMDAECVTCGHTWNPIAQSLIRGSGCPSCSVSGYDIKKPGIFYLYELAYLGDMYLGFGISNQYSERERAHIKNLNSMSAVITAKYLYNFENGQECLDLETSIKQTLKSENLSHNLGIEGFITEAAKYSAVRLILQKIDASNAELAESSSI